MHPILAIPCTADTDRAMAQLRDRLARQGVRLSGVIQHHTVTPSSRPQMWLTGACGGFSTQISQDLGPGATGCRLDADALERAVAHVTGTLAQADILFVNRFGTHEAMGRGFAPLMAQAVESGQTVIIAVAPDKRDAFENFSGQYAAWVTPAQLAHWGPLHLARKTPG